MSARSPRLRSKHSPIPFPVRVPFVESLGIELHGFGEGQAELRVDLDEAHLNTRDVAHGGVVMTLLDVAMAMAARSADLQGSGVATIEMKTSFMRPAEHRLRALAKVLHKTTTLAFCEASLFDAEGTLCANASGTFKYLRGRVAAPTSLQVAADQAAGQVASQAAHPSPAQAPTQTPTQAPVSSHPEPKKDDTP